MGRLGTLELKLELVRNQGDELRIGWLSLGVADGVAEEPLQRVQIAPVPGNFDGVTDGTLHSAGGCPKGFRYLGIEDFRNGVRVPDGPRRGYEGLLRSLWVYCFLYRPVSHYFTGVMLL